MNRTEHEAAMAAQHFIQAVLMVDRPKAIQRDGQALFGLLWKLGFRPESKNDDLAERAQILFDRVKDMPEKDPAGFIKLVELRNIVPDLITALRR